VQIAALRPGIIDNRSMFEPLNLQTPPLVIGLGLVFAVIGAAVLAHAVWRRRRLQAWASGEAEHFEGTDSRGERPDAPLDVRVEIIAGLAALLLGTAGLIYGIGAQAQLDNMLESNTIAKYPQVQKVEPQKVRGYMQKWRGNLLEAEVTTVDGERFHVGIRFDPETGEPTIQDHSEFGGQE